MNSSLLVLETQRRKLLLGMAVCFVLSFTMVFVVSPKDLTSAYQLLSGILAIAGAAVCLGGYHFALYRLPVPVTHRQLAWLPTVCFALLCVAGFVGMGIGAWAVHSIGPSQWGATGLLFLQSLPVLLLVFTVLDRMIRYLGSSGFIFIGFVNPLLFASLEDKNSPFGVAIADGSLFLILHEYANNYGWPLCMAFSLFLILQAPGHIATLEHPQAIPAAKVKMYIRNTLGAYKPSRLKALADMLMYPLPLMSVAMLTIPIRMMWEQFSFFGYIVGFALVLAVPFIMIQMWASVQASNFERGKSVLIFLMKCSLIFTPVAQTMGARGGLVTTCEHCRKRKFIWARKCPHCESLNQGTFGRMANGMKDWAEGNVEDKNPIFVKIFHFRMAGRILTHVYLLGIGLMINQGGIFYEQSFTILLNKDGVVAPEGTQERIKEFLASEENTAIWLSKNGGETLVLPSRYRIELVQMNHQILEVHCYWLRWEEGGEVAKHIRDRIVNNFPDIPLDYHDTITTNENHRGDVSSLGIRRYLDGGIHWKYRKNKHPAEILSPGADAS